jgi:hypothetical protein
MKTIPITNGQADTVRDALDIMRDVAGTDDFEYEVDDLPVVTDLSIDFPTDNVEVVEDLLYRLENRVADVYSPEEIRMADSLAIKTRLAFGMRPLIEPAPKPSIKDLTLRGAHPELVRTGVFRGVDFKPLTARFWKLEAMRAEGPLPKIRWRALSRGPYACGRAFTGRGRIVVSVGPSCDIERAAEVLLHELVHMTCPLRENHGEIFRRRLIACAREAFGLSLDTAALLALGPGKHTKRAYAIDDAIIEVMLKEKIGDKLRQDVTVKFEAPPPETEEQIQDRRASARAARAVAKEEHARAKLAAWQKAVKTAQRHVTKWRAKVRYYEKRQLQAAARKGSPA